MNTNFLKNKFCKKHQSSALLSKKPTFEENYLSVKSFSSPSASKFYYLLSIRELKYWLIREQMFFFWFTTRWVRWVFQLYILYFSIVVSYLWGTPNNNKNRNQHLCDLIRIFIHRVTALNYCLAARSMEFRVWVRVKNENYSWAKSEL